MLSLMPTAHLRTVGVDPDVPPKRTTDPELLRFAETEEFAIVTFDKDTMPGHAAAHVAAGRRTWGVFVFPNGFNLTAGFVAAELQTIYEASQADEWLDITEFLP